MSQVCTICGPQRLFPDDALMCDIHIRSLDSYEPESAPEFGPDAMPAEPLAPAAPDPMLACWNCGARPHPGNDECVECHRTLTPPALVIRFRDGNVEVELGSQVELGRHGHHGRLFRSFGNVSRRHAVVGVDADGRAWIEPNPTPNGTFVNQREIAPSVRRPLESYQVVRFALHAEGTVMVYSHS
ncbi:FHA domain-containing protein [Allorhizocola rhizosphaerae]|uniref:FHA domain-containing protein n=1 Tax=Allorhizocola rhizosphaerae TaxID=1872709 RepID=UPI000E3D413F|nr:FHA domain-containing protein [Allorhizocola rhizosphaerae]